MNRTEVVRRAIVVNPQGMHARPAQLLSQTAQGFEASIRVGKGPEQVDGKSLLDLLILAATQGTELTITADGPDAQAAAEAIAALIARGFDEAEPAA